MGGLRPLMPLTYWAFLIGALALAGMPPFSGFFSKDSILAAALASGGWYGYLLWAAGMVGTFLTGLYAFRMLFMVFWGEPSAFVREHLHHLERGPRRLDARRARRRARRAGGGRRLPAVRRDLDADHRLARAGRDPRSSRRRARRRRSRASSRSLLGLAGIGVAWWIYGARRPRRGSARRCALLERKF